MNQRLQQFLAAENISQSQFADYIGVARASVSHIIAGRNKPGFDFIENMSKRYPALNLEWLITGKGKMYKGQSADQPVVKDESAGLFDDDLFDSAPEPEQPQPAPVVENRPENPVLTPTVAKVQPKIVASTELDTSVKVSQVVNSQRSIAKIVVFFSDGTYQELH